MSALEDVRFKEAPLYFDELVVALNILLKTSKINLVEALGTCLLKNVSAYLTYKGGDKITTVL